MSDRLHAAIAFTQTLWLNRSSQSRTQFKRWQTKQLDKWLQNDLPKVKFYADTPPKLHCLPVINKALLMAQFEDFNIGQITAKAAWQAFEATGEINGINIGASTGTSGNRSLYAITKAEQFQWLGTILAKTIPGFLFRTERVAVLLPQVSVLYDATHQTSTIKLQFFDLHQAPEHWLPILKQFNPTTIIAPPRVLRFISERRERLSPLRIYAGAETLDPVDRKIIESNFGLSLGEIYMASEGLFGVTCKYGTMHLVEDANYFEFEQVGNGLVSPLITSFQRRFQIMARYQMNDLLRLSTKRCPCRSPLQAVDEIVGRMDDSFLFRQPGGHDILITPDILRNTVLDTSRKITDFRIRRENKNKVVLTLHLTLPQEIAQAAHIALKHQFAAYGLWPEIVLKRDELKYQPGRKLRRVENCFREHY